MKRVFLIVLDSLGIGHAPDAAAFGDAGSDTLKAVSSYPAFSAPHLEEWGLFHLTSYHRHVKNTVASWACMQEKSAGKDTTIGHWEIAGLVTEKPFPVYPNGFPQTVLDDFTRKTGY